jgi:DNA-binding transcriptional regulator YiaG
MGTKQKKTKVTSKNVGDLLLKSVDQGLRHTRGEITLREAAARLAPTPPDFSSKAIKNLRTRFDLTQDLLAQLLGVKTIGGKTLGARN